MQGRTPELKPLIGVPVWWYNHGTKTQVICLNLVDRSLILAGSAAELRIRRMSKDH